MQVGSDGHSRVKYLDYGSKEAWNHPFSWFLLPSLERYSEYLALHPTLKIEILLEYSKLAVHLWTNDLARRLSEEQSKVIVLITHPGAILSVRTSFHCLTIAHA